MCVIIVAVVRGFEAVVLTANAIMFFLFLFFLRTFTFQLLATPWSQVPSLLPPGSRLHFLSRIGISNCRFFVERC